MGQMQVKCLTTLDIAFLLFMLSTPGCLSLICLRILPSPPLLHTVKIWNSRDDSCEQPWGSWGSWGFKLEVLGTIFCGCDKRPWPRQLLKESMLLRVHGLEGESLHNHHSRKHGRRQANMMREQ